MHYVGTNAGPTTAGPDLTDLMAKIDRLTAAVTDSELRAQRYHDANLVLQDQVLDLERALAKASVPSNASFASARTIPETAGGPPRKPPPPGVSKSTRSSPPPAAAPPEVA